MKILSAAAAAAAFCATAAAQPPIEAYGRSPRVESVAISPDGAHYAFISQVEGEKFFAVVDAGGKQAGAGRLGDAKSRGIYFSSNDHVVVVASETSRAVGFRGEWENSWASSYNIKTKKMRGLLGGTEDLFPAQAGLGKIVGRLSGKSDIFMPAFMGHPSEDPTYDLLKVDLDIGRGYPLAKGGHHTIDWFVDDKGVVLAREDFDDKRKFYQILSRKSGRLETIFSASNAAIPPYSVLGVSPDATALIVGTRPDDTDFFTVARMSFGGEVSAPVFSRPDREVELVLTDINRKVIGVRFSGLLPTYEFYDQSLTSSMESLAANFDGASVRLVDWTLDYGKLVVLVEGGATAPGYYLFTRATNEILQIAKLYPEISDADVGEVLTIEFKARDGRKIPSILTLPPGADLGQSLPAIVLPHGGPQAYDAVGFDYIAQFFASRGYLVLQPNFRGSDGFGAEFREAGYGEWGGKMQDDITDGVKALIKNKWVDPERICIIGASFGGYAALAGGAYTPELYKCVAAIAPVTDLPLMLSTEKNESGGNSAIYAYWSRLIGDRRSDAEKLRAISPVNAAANFTAPVLLIHGDDDTVVPVVQSRRMEAALQRADKSVRFVKLKGEDHWLSVNETRLQALRELDRFVAETIGPPAQ